MNYDQARQVDPTSNWDDAGKWRYTTMNDGRVWPVGYCRDCPGHDTREGAYEHQTQWVIDDANFDGSWATAQHQCEAPGCGVWTQRFASHGAGHYATVDLCDEHCNRETLALIIGTVGDSWHS